MTALAIVLTGLLIALKAFFVIGEYSPWDNDYTGHFTRKLFNWAEDHGRVRAMIYYRSVSPDNAFDINQMAQDAARASIGNDEEIARRRSETAAGRAQLEEACRALGLAVAGPSVTNFVYVETGEDARVVFDRLLREGVIVRPLGPVGADDAIRVTVGTSEENEFFAVGLGHVLSGVS